MQYTTIFSLKIQNLQPVCTQLLSVYDHMLIFMF